MSVNTSPASRRNRFSFLMAGPLRLPTKDYAPCLCALASLAGPSPDEFTLEFGETAQNGQH